MKRANDHLTNVWVSIVLKATHNNKLKHAILLSIVMHGMVIAVLICSSIHQPKKVRTRGGITVINTVMVNPVAVLKQYNRHKKQNDGKPERQQAHVQEENAGKNHKQAKSLKVDTQVKAEQSTALKKKYDAIIHTKQVAREDKIHDIKQTSTAQTVKQSSEVDSLLDRLTKDGGEIKTKEHDSPSGSDKSNSSVRGEKIDAYKTIINKNIRKKFYDYTHYIGKICTLRIKLAPDGMLLSVNAESGDPVLCQAAIYAAKAADIPHPPSQEVYEVFKNATIEFTPQ